MISQGELREAIATLEDGLCPPAAFDDAFDLVLLAAKVMLEVSEQMTRMGMPDPLLAIGS
jgi:hypothetical protein